MSQDVVVGLFLQVACQVPQCQFRASFEQPVVLTSKDREERWAFARQEFGGDKVGELVVVSRQIFASSDNFMPTSMKQGVAHEAERLH